MAINILVAGYWFSGEKYIYFNQYHYSSSEKLGSVMRNNVKYLFLTVNTKTSKGIQLVENIVEAVFVVYRRQWPKPSWGIYLAHYGQP